MTFAWSFGSRRCQRGFRRACGSDHPDEARKGGGAVTIDIAFDLHSDLTGKNPDPDAASPTLLRYHHLLWSKPLPSGQQFELSSWTRVPSH